MIGGAMIVGETALGVMVAPARPVRIARAVAALGADARRRCRFKNHLHRRPLKGEKRRERQSERLCPGGGWM